MEACASAHYWAREIGALGHTVKLMPPAYVKPYVKRGKTDAADAEAIAEAVTRPTMRFVAVKTVDQQGALMLHKVRDLLVRRCPALRPTEQCQQDLGGQAARAEAAEGRRLCARQQDGADRLGRTHTQAGLRSTGRVGHHRIGQAVPNVQGC
jgi:transposase